MKKTIDAKGLSCPQPVLETKKAIGKYPNDELEILVDTVTSRENVGRFARKNGYKTDFKKLDDGYSVTITK